MKNPIKSYFERNEKTWTAQGIKGWERQRAKGKWQFILKIGLPWSLITISMLTLFEYLIDGRINIEIFWFRVPLFVSFGFVMGLIFWRIGERKYQKTVSAEKEGLKEMKNLNLLILTALFLITGTVSAQSLKPENPYPIQEGINKGTSDSLVGTHYWYFYATPGSNKLTVRFKAPTTLYGSQMNNNVLTITLTDEKKTWKTTKTVTSSKNSTEATFSADKVKTKMKIIVSIAPPNQNLIRMGGDYEIEVTGDAAFDKIKNTVDPIIRTYESKVNFYGTAKFLADGTIETTSGSVGKWKVFDAENRIYTVTIDNFRFSLQYLPGYGLVKPDDPTNIVFQELRR